VRARAALLGAFEHRDARSWLLLFLALVPILCLGIGGFILFRANQRTVDAAEHQLKAIESLHIVHEASAIVDVISVASASSAVVSDDVVEVIEAERQNARTSVAELAVALEDQSAHVDEFFAGREASAASELRGSLRHIGSLLGDLEPGQEADPVWNAQLFIVSSAIDDLWEGFQGGENVELGLNDALIEELIEYRSLLSAERRHGARLIDTGVNSSSSNRRNQLRLSGRDRATAYAIAQATYRQMPEMRPLPILARDPAAQLSKELNTATSLDQAARDRWYLEGSEISSTVGVSIEAILFDLADDRRGIVEQARKRRLLHASWSSVLLGLAGLLFWVTGGEVRHRRSVEAAHEAALAALSAKAERDPLTALWNRVRPEARIPQMLTAPAAGPIVLVYLDLDRFKAVNDVWGHEVGDLVLVEIARRVEQTAPDGFEVVRFGGDEFVVYGPLSTSPQKSASRVGEALLEAVARPIAITDTSIVIEATAGMTISTATSTASELLLEADAALITAKRGRRGAAVLYDRVARRDTTLIRALPKAISDGELFCHFQPAYSMASNRCIGVEALIRWMHHDEIISPGEFVPLAESFGLTTQLTHAVLRAVAELQAEPTFPVDCRVWINISPVEMEANNFALALVNAARVNGVQLKQLGVEITETAAISDPGHLAAQLRQLREVGIQVAIDDFGNGYSPLGYLRDLPFDVLKLDRSIVSHIDSNLDLQIIVRGIIGMMIELGVEVVAEGVERREEVVWAADAGAHVAQGFFYARPVPHAEALELVTDPTPPPVIRDSRDQSVSV